MWKCVNLCEEAIEPDYFCAILYSWNDNPLNVSVILTYLMSKLKLWRDTFTWLFHKGRVSHIYKRYLQRPVSTITSKSSCYAQQAGCVLSWQSAGLQSDVERWYRLKYHCKVADHIMTIFVQIQKLHYVFIYTNKTELQTFISWCNPVLFK